MSSTPGNSIEAHWRIGLVLAVGLFWVQGLMAQSNDTLKYPIEDRSGDFINDGNDNPFYLKDPPNIVKSVEYDPETNRYIVSEKIGNTYYRPPTYMTYEEYVEYISKEQMNAYFAERTNAINLIERQGLSVDLGDDKKEDGEEPIIPIDIRPQGNIEMTLGGNVQRIARPDLPIRQQRQGGFEFDMDINMNVLGKIGDLVELNIKYNTQASFDFDNQVKLQYTGKENDIIKEIQAGDVSFPLNTQLITGSQKLFGLKTKLQFGRATITSVISQNKSKKESIVLEDGAQKQDFEVTADQYDANRHYFLGQFFRDQYDEAMSDLPNIRSLATIERIDVWVTNRQGANNNVRDVVAFMDLGESDPYSPSISSLSNNPIPRNEANNLYENLTSASFGRSTNTVTNQLQSQLNLDPVQDYEKTYARKLSSSEYTFHPQLGFISLNSTLNPNEVLAVSYRYSYNGTLYQVGEFSEQVDTTSEVLYLKMLKSTSVRPQLPIWNLMMKNVYSLGAFNISQEDFRLDVYYNDPGGGVVRYIPEGNLRGIQLIELLNLDNVNYNGDPQPDGIFDFVPNLTIKPNNGRIIFPVTEPFGDHLRSKFVEAGNENLSHTYIYDQLYDSTKVIAQQFPEFNRFIIRGVYKSSTSNEISLGAFNIPEGSVTVTMGGQKLTEGVDYTVDYNLGRVKIINEALLNSGGQIKVDFENSALFGFQTKTLYGTRLDYKISDKFKWGATIMRLSEKPFTEKVNIGDDPIQNTIMGLDMDYATELPFLTKGIDWVLPFHETKDVSSIQFNAEVAHLSPSHPKGAIGKDGTVYIDDFEGTSSGYDLKFPATSWRLASTPRGATDKNGDLLFPEADNSDDLSYGYNRAKLSWYNIDPLFVRNNVSTPDYIKDNAELYLNHYNREVRQTEVFPNKDVESAFDANLLTFDLHYRPEIRGPYNYESSDQPSIIDGEQISSGVNTTGRLKDPASRWGGIMRSIDNNDFEAANIEFIEFWMMDPFIEQPFHSGGDLYINLGTISEDVLRDARMLYENGLSDDPTDEDNTAWGDVPKIPPITNTFDNDPDARAYQDVGFDGLTDDDEVTKFQDVLSNLQSFLLPDAYNNIAADPSSDNFTYYRDDSYDSEEAEILDRYSDYNGPHGNSPVATSDQFASAATNQPDAEDLNRDNTLNENEEYFQYRIELEPGMDVASHPYIVSTSEVAAFTDQVNDVSYDATRWYQFKIPIRAFDDRIGGIQDFKSIQFVRMYLTGFEDSIVLRFAELDLVRNQWRTYLQPLGDPTDHIPNDEFDETTISVSSVNIEEDSERDPVNYVLPPGLEREEGIGSQTRNFVTQNEQAISVQVCGLEDGDVRAIYKNINLDVRKYKRVKMYLHAEEIQPIVNNSDVTAFLRMGSDFKDNFYQYEVPMQITLPGEYNNDDAADRRAVWPDSMDFALEDFINLKLERNNANWPINVPYTKVNEAGAILTVVGNPDLGFVKTTMLGVKNPKVGDPNNPRGDDDGQPKCAEVWFNEFRLTGFDERGGTAALAAVDVKLADFGNVGFSTSMHTIGFGQVEQKVDERYQDNYVEYDFTTQLQLDKLLPKAIGLKIPFYATVAQSFSTPEFDPYQFDIPLEAQIDQFKINNIDNDSIKKYKRQAQDVVTRKGFNFTNVRFVNTGGGSPKIYSPSNWNFTYAYTLLEKSDPYIEYDREREYKGSIGYNYAPTPKYIYPFKNMIKSRSKYYNIIKDINFNVIPGTIGFNTGMRRTLGELQLRSLGDEKFPIKPSFNKNWIWDRNYVIRYNPFKSLTLDFNATANARIDEPAGLIDTDEEKEEIWNNIKSGGRVTNYTHSLNASYNLPINKIPIFDWVQVRTGYSSNYTWTASPLVKGEGDELVANPLGNTINNSQNVRINGDLNFKKLYSKSPLLKPYNSSNPSLGDKEKNDKKREQVKKARAKLDKDIEKVEKEKDKLKEELKKVKADNDLEDDVKKAKIKQLKADIKKKKKRIKKLKKDKRNKQPPVNQIKSAVVNPLIALKKVSVNYSENKSTTLPGYLPETDYLGTDQSFNSPGMGFVFGEQPGMNLFSEADAGKRDAWLDQAGENGWISHDQYQINKFSQSAAQNLDIKASIEPFKDVKLDLTAKRNFTVRHEQLFKDTSMAGNQDLLHLIPTESGSYSVSFLSWNSAFENFDEDWLTQTYQTFEANREIISQRLAQENDNADPDAPFVDENGNVFENFREGYGRKSQDVLIPAFIAAYSGKSANDVKLNPFKNVPLPNWRLTYAGFTKFKWAKSVFTKLNISHGYSSTLNVSSFNTNLFYDGDGTYSNPAVVDTLNGNYFPLYQVPNVVINEQFSPLIGVDMAFKNNVNARFDYKKSRTLTMSFVDYQLRENQSKTITIGAGYKLKGLVLPFIRWAGKKVVLQNDINFKFDMSIRDNVTVNHRLDEGISEPTSGVRTVSIQPSIDYTVNKRLNIRLFLDRNQTKPKTSSAFPTSSTRGGVKIRFSLAP